MQCDARIDLVVVISSCALQTLASYVAVHALQKPLLLTICLQPCLTHNLVGQQMSCIVFAWNGVKSTHVIVCLEWCMQDAVQHVIKRSKSQHICCDFVTCC